mgnify:CR=1 FL=1
MKGYKGFNKGMICLGKQYAEDTVFEEPEANIRENGMHFCKNPWDVLDYYGFMDYNGEPNEFAEVESLDEVKTNDYEEYCTKKLKIGAKLSLAEFIKVCTDFMVEKATVAQMIDDAVSTGNESIITSTENGSTVVSTGSGSTVVSTGSGSKVVFTGYGSTVVSTGSGSNVTGAEDYSVIAATGRCSHAVSTGNNAKIAVVGDFSKVISTGRNSKVVSIGNYSTVASMDFHSKVVSTGNADIVFCAGDDSLAKAKKGSWITLVEWGYNKQEHKYVPVNVKTEYVDGERIKEDVFYALKNGEFQEVGS